jgi:hypothetical protein
MILNFICGDHIQGSVPCVNCEPDARFDTPNDDDTRFSLVDALLADVSCHVTGYTAGDAIETADYLLENFTITRKQGSRKP